MNLERVDCVYADIQFVKRRDAPRIEPPSALASLGGYASPSQGGIDGGGSSQHLKRRDAASPSHGGASPSQGGASPSREGVSLREGNFDGCFRYWESWSLGEKLKNAILQNSKTPSSESNRGASAQRDLKHGIH
jgi:hypothetical protein